LQLARARPALVICNLLAKLPVVLGYVLIFGNIGWLAFLRRPVVWAVDLALFAVIAFNSMFGLLVVPRLGYLFGMIASAALFGAISFMLAAEMVGSGQVGIFRPRLRTPEG
jgi:hypothetical protein